MGKDTRHHLEIVSVRQNFGEITDRMVRHISGNINEFGIAGKPKMIARLMSEVARGIEQHFADASLAYVNEKIAEQIDTYVSAGFPKLCGMSTNEFRSRLNWLSDDIRAFFTPPARHPIMDGEFIFLIVIPPEWVSIRAQVALLCGDDAIAREESLVVTTVDGAQKRSSSPYALVGINGGRELRNCEFSKADALVRQEGRTYFAFHEAVQLFLQKPNFLSEEMGVQSTQREAYALDSRASGKLIKFSAIGTSRSLEFVDQKHVTGGGVGKPYFTKVITSD